MSTAPLPLENPDIPRRRIPISTWVIAIVGLAIVIAAGFFVAGVSGYGPLDFNRDKRIDDYCSRAIAKANFLWTLMLGDESKSSLSSEELLKGLQNHNLLIKRSIQETEKDRTPPGCRAATKPCSATCTVSSTLPVKTSSPPANSMPRTNAPRPAAFSSPPRKKSKRECGPVLQFATPSLRRAPS